MPLPQVEFCLRNGTRTLVLSLPLGFPLLTTQLNLTMPIAIKEWAVTVRALAEGEQLLTLRKGGVSETDRHFQLEHERFFSTRLSTIRPPISSASHISLS